MLIFKFYYFVLIYYLEYFSKKTTCPHQGCRVTLKHGMFGKGRINAECASFNCQFSE